MKQVNFSHPGGFPLEQETLDRLQTAYRHELFEALKSHLGINPDNDYIIAPPKNGKEGWAIIHPKNEQGIRTKEGILYPIQTGAQTNFLKTIRTGTNLTYGTGVIQTAYFDYEAQYISDTDYANRPVSPPLTDALTVNYYNLNDPAFIVIKDIQTIEGIIQTIEANINSIKTDINVVKQSYLPLNGSKAMEGDLDLGSYKLSKLDIKDSAVANVRVTDFRLGSNLGRAIVNDNTNLSLNYGSDWQNTSIGGKVYLENLNTNPEDFKSLESSANSLLLIDSANQVTKTNNLLNSLLSRITKLEKQPATAVPKGMIAIWGKPAPFPEGWEEYEPLRGRMPVGFDSLQSEFNNWNVRDGGSKIKKLTIAEMPEHDHESIEWTVGKAVNDAGKGTTAVSGHLSTYGGPQTGKINMTSRIGGGQSFSLLNPYRVVHFIEYTGKTSDPADIIAPTTPTNLIASKIGTKSLILSWNASTDNVGVTNYLVYKDSGNTLLAELGKDLLTYDVKGLSVNTTYTFQVIAKDAAGNLSDPAVLATATLAADSTAPTVPSFLHCVHNGQGYIQVEWGQSQDDDSPIDYELSRSAFGSLFTIVKKNPNTYYSEQVSSNGTYTYRVRAIDPSGNASAYKEASITISSL
ncbi:hypothetical protein FLA105534_00776 [Flavobacterium bizetiae]|uniref:Fibronectin type-III domain-containing protein n=1 Tax=Flavobacterium bizetiae TaxID=2704140 RepID=A0A6J4GBG8_9FLAO|nr:fibronectin type III domain-containing protein [Flavobacterium bizetiae]CAA9195669.1 hypothetical protein FLA105534_00776 [Flavobacterium bizetiae]CAD5340459.1 hypothetical protein FLA105535_00413 [Flavobacterium bizetiae]CAD5346862.1 hypothetical protein FLA105534_00805 [Flavobacterium bizetiae]